MAKKVKTMAKRQLYDKRAKLCQSNRPNYVIKVTILKERSNFKEMGPMMEKKLWQKE